MSKPKYNCGTVVKVSLEMMPSGDRAAYLTVRMFRPTRAQELEFASLLGAGLGAVVIAREDLKDE